MSICKKVWEIKLGDGTRPGVSKLPVGYNFTIETDSSEPLKLVFYKKGSQEPEQEITLSDYYRTGNIYSVAVLKQNLCSYEYEYRQGENSLADPCGKILSTTRKFGEKTEKEKRYKVLKEVEVEPLKKWIPYEDMILYKIHVRGYTMHKNSGVRKKGTFQGLIDKIPYWKNLGITSLELMPVYDFYEYPLEEKKDGYIYREQRTEHLNYWGYTKGNYFAPKNSYCGSSCPEQEVKTFISSLHKEKMECFLDFYFPKDIAPQMVLEILRFWRIEYKVDGFVLMGEGVWMELLARDAVLADTKLICPGFDEKQIFSVIKKKPRRLAEYHPAFQNSMRRFLKGDEDQLPGVLYYTKKNPATHGVINYVANHDGFTLADLVSYDYRHNEDNGEDNRDGSSYNYSWNCGIEGPTRKIAIHEMRERQMRNAILMLLLSQGTPLIYGGDEFGNTQNGNNNAYCQDNEIGWVNWAKKKKLEGFTSFIKNVITFRKSHPILHMPYELRATDYKSLGWPELSYHSEKAWFSNTESCSRRSGILYCGGYAERENGEPDDFIYVMYNMHWHECAFAIPDLPEEKNWYLAIDSGKKSEEAVCQPGTEVKIKEKKTFHVPGRNIIVFIGK